MNWVYITCLSIYFSKKDLGVPDTIKIQNDKKGLLSSGKKMIFHLTSWNSDYVNNLKSKVKTEHLWKFITPEACKEKT